MVTKIMNAVLVTDELDARRSLYIKDDTILALTEEALPFDEVIDAGGLYVSPGFIDIHTHGAGGHSFTDGTVGDILEAAHMHAEHGTTSIYPTSPSISTEDILRFIENNKAAIAKNAPGKPHIAGTHLEGPYFAQSQRGAQNPEFIKNPQPEEYKKFVESGEGTVRRISFAPELPGAMELTEYLGEHDIVASYAHTDAVYSEIKPLIDKGCRLATHLYSGMNTVTRRNLMRNLGAVETTFLEESTDAEIICDGIHLPLELLLLIYKIKGPDRLCMVTDSMRAAGMPEGDSEIGGLRVIVKDGVAYLRDMTAFAGSVATTDRLVRVMHKQVGIPLVDCITMMCRTPARVMNLSRRGELRPGYFADLVFFDGDINVKKVLIEGRELI